MIHKHWFQAIIFPVFFAALIGSASLEAQNLYIGFSYSNMDDNLYFDYEGYYIYREPVVIYPEPIFYDPIDYIAVRIIFGDPVWYYPPVVWLPRRQVLVRYYPRWRHHHARAVYYPAPRGYYGNYAHHGYRYDTQLNLRYNYPVRVYEQAERAKHRPARDWQRRRQDSPARGSAVQAGHYRPGVTPVKRNSVKRSTGESGRREKLAGPAKGQKRSARRAADRVVYDRKARDHSPQKKRTTVARAEPQSRKTVSRKVKSRTTFTRQVARRRSADLEKAGRFTSPRPENVRRKSVPQRRKKTVQRPASRAGERSNEKQIKKSRTRVRSSGKTDQRRSGVSLVQRPHDAKRSFAPNRKAGKRSKVNVQKSSRKNKTGSKRSRR